MAATRGLTRDEVAERVRRGETNAANDRASRSYASIVRENVFTLFNLILGVLVLAVLLVGSPRDALFGLVLVVNAVVGVVQEVRAKRVLDRLSVLTASQATVLRDGAEERIPSADVVLGDVVVLRAGDQVPADGEVLDSDGAEVDESLLTGESIPQVKRPGDRLLSGSFVAAGAARFVTTAVGDAAYAHRLSAEARRFRLVRSELRRGIDRILRVVLLLIVPVGVLTAATQYADGVGPRGVVLATVTALVAMIPQGLVLLTSVAFAVSVVALARRRAVVQELAAVEVLARVDVVCLDKTGTLTEAALEVGRLEPLVADAPAADVLGVLARLDAGRTAEGLRARYESPEGWRVVARTPFASSRQWGAADLGENGCWVLGAPERLLPDAAAPARTRAHIAALAGDRVLLLARATRLPSAEEGPGDVTPVALVMLAERVRPDAADTLRYFAEQGVQVRVLSGDAPATVAAVAKRVGLDADDPVDAHELPDDDAALTRLMEGRTVFGRISPDDKRRVVQALQRAGHTVAMTGDGVNDVPALKAADFGIAMGSGADAARGVARMVLLDGCFATLPFVVAEGRRVMANIERVGKLFLTKTVYAVLLALSVGAAAVPFPFLPRHLTLIDAVTIGIPAFFLALAHDPRPYRPGFVRRVLRFSVPCGIGASVAALAGYLGATRLAGVPLEEARTVATLALGLVGLWVLSMLAQPLIGWRASLVQGMALLLAVAVLVPASRHFFALTLLPPLAVGISAASAAGGILLVQLGLRVSGYADAQ